MPEKIRANDAKPSRHSRRTARIRAQSLRPPSASGKKKRSIPLCENRPSATREFTTVSSYPIRRLYTGADLAGLGSRNATWAFRASLLTRAVFIPRCIAAGCGPCGNLPALGPPQETNARFRYLLSQGQTGLSVAFDLPTLMGYDADHALAAAKWESAAWRSVRWRTWKRCSTSIPLGDVTTSMTINSPAAVLWAMYLAVAEKQGADWKTLSGTLQNDILKEYIAQKEYIYPPEPSHAAGDGYDRIRRDSTRRSSIRFRSAAITSARRARRRFRNWRSRCATGSNTWSGRMRAGWTWMSLRRGFRFSSTRTTISSRRSPSIARRGASGTRR